MIQTPLKYKNSSGNSGQVFESLCLILSGRSSDVNWQEFQSEDWILLSEIARSEGIGPLIYWLLKDENWPDGVSINVAADLMGQYYETHARNMNLFSELDRILAEFVQAEIPVLVLKGVVFAQTIYEDIGLRPMEDLDLLVRNRDIDSALKIGEKLGYHQPSVELWQGADQDFWHETVLQNKEDVRLELHWNLVGSDTDLRSPPIDWVWTQIEEVESQKTHSRNSKTLNIYTHITYCCAHLALQHGLQETRLLWLYDIYKSILTASEEFEWDKLLMSAKKLGWCASLKEILTRVRSIFGLSIPNGFLSDLEITPASDRHLIRDLGISVVPANMAAQKISTLRWQYKIKFVVSHLFPSPRRMRFRYKPDPDWLWPFYYFYRWGIIFRDLLRSKMKKNQTKATNIPNG